VEHDTEATEYTDLEDKSVTITNKTDRKKFLKLDKIEQEKSRRQEKYDRENMLAYTVFDGEEYCALKIDFKGKNVYVIDVYRTPVERKISEFFEKISPYHFNNTNENISKYSIKRLYDRFNKIFPHIENYDHYFEKYNINQPIPFDFENKYTIQIINNIKYIKLRLCDSYLWSSILSKIFNIDIIIIEDYKTENKPLGELYKTFKDNYKLPCNYIEYIENNKYLNFYYNEEEKTNYINHWKNKICENSIPYTENEFKFYINLCLENQFINDIERSLEC
jgi:hypothetical protein